MITFFMGSGDRENPEVMCIGLSHKNLELLKAGKPIRIKGERLAPNVGVKEIFIMADKDEETIANNVKKWAEEREIAVDADRHGWPGDPQS